MCFILLENTFKEVWLKKKAFHAVYDNYDAILLRVVTL